MNAREPGAPQDNAYAFAERCQHYAQEKSAWIASHPSADHKQIEAASREIAKKWDV
jgi:hypothetical protein